MAGQFFVLVDERDREKFRKFTIGKFSAHAKKLLAQNKSNHLWGLHKGQIRSGRWTEVCGGSEILFAVPKNNFELIGRVGKKAINKSWGKKIWPDQPNSVDITNFLFFERLEKTKLPFSEVTGRSLDPVSAYLPGLYRMKDAINTVAGDGAQTVPIKRLPEPVKNSFPKKNSSEVSRFVRDSLLVRKLKKLYNNRCQICGYTMEYSKGKFYSEVHHYKPLEENGNDDVDNMLVLCPNHHAEFDYKMLMVGTDGMSVINRNGEKVAKIKFQPGHKLNTKNIESRGDTR